MRILELIKLFAKLKDVRAAVEETTGQQAPIYLSRKVIGSILILFAGVLLYLTGVNLDVNMVTNLTDNIEHLIGAIIGIYGFIMFLISALKKKAVN